MIVHYHNRSKLSPDKDNGATYHDTLKSLMSVSDVLSVCCPASNETINLINKETLEYLPKGAVVTNVARGDIVDDEALIDALERRKVYAVGWTFGASASYWIDNESFDLEGSGAEAYSIAVHDGDVYTAGRDDGACYWKNTTKNKLSGGDSSGYGIAIKDNGDVFIGGYYMNNHHYIIPARWKNGNRTNLSRPSGGDGEVQDVKIYNGTPYFFGMSMAPNSMLGYLPKASYWQGNSRNDMPNVGGWQKGIYGGESYGGFVDGTGVYVAGKIDWIGEVDEDGNDIPETGGTYAHYWHNGTKVDLLGGVFNDMWVSTAYDVAATDGYVIVAGDVATANQTQVPAIWVNDALTKLEGDNTHGVAKAIFIE